MTSLTSDHAKVLALRAELPATSAGIFMNAGTCGPLPATSAKAAAEVADRELAVGRAHRDAYEELLVRLDEARAGAAAVLGTTLDRVALTHSTTEGMCIALDAIDWRPGDRVITTGDEHPGITAPLAMLRDRAGVEVDVVDVAGGGDDERAVAGVVAALRPQTRLVALSHVLWSTGAILPVERIVEVAHEAGVPVAVDGAQAAGAIPVAFDAMGADFYAAPGQKWLLGPEGTGMLAVSRAALEWAEPRHAGYFSAATPYGAGREHLWADARRFETAGYHKPSIVALARSIGWLSMFVGLPWAHARSAALARDAADRLGRIPGVTVLTPKGSAGTLVTFSIAGWSAQAAAEEMGRRIFLIARFLPGGERIRLSIGWWNTEHEVGRVTDAVAELARHTPETLPRRPAIAIVDAVADMGDR